MYASAPTTIQVIYVQLTRNTALSMVHTLIIVDNGT